MWAGETLRSSELRILVQACAVDSPYLFGRYNTMRM